MAGLASGMGLVGKGLDTIATTANRPSLLSNIYDRKLQREAADNERRKIEAEANYKDQLAGAAQAEDAAAAQQAAIYAGMPQVDLQGTDREVIKQMRAQFIYLSNAGMGSAVWVSASLK